SSSCRASASAFRPYASRDPSRSEGQEVVGRIDSLLAAKQNLEAACLIEKAPSLFGNALPPHPPAHVVEVGTHTGEGKQDSAGTELTIAKMRRGLPRSLF